MLGVLETDTVATWESRLSKAGVPVGPVQSIDQALNHAQVNAVGMVIDNLDDRAGVDRAIGCPIHFNDESPTRRGRAPLVGEHTGDVLLSFGFSDAEVRALIDLNAAFQPKPGTNVAFAPV